jgi:DNA-binding response OmpR family regulator
MPERKHILIVEDDKQLASMYRTALIFEGFDVAVAGDGVAALRRIDEHRPDLVVLDLHLPHVRGEEVLPEVVSICDAPVIIVTGEEPKAAVDAASAIIRKPCPPDRLLTEIDHYLHAA